MVGGLFHWDSSTVHKKNYYNDKHESPENIAYRKQFIKRYFEYELFVHRWVQLPISEYREMCKDGCIFSGVGYEYEKDGTTYIEFHVDDHPSFTERDDLHPFGGNVSVSKPSDAKPLLIFGQDKCIFKQFALCNKTWVGPNGKTPLVPKSDGQGLMVSAFVSREYGFGWDLTKSQLKLVNKYREKQTYCDEKAALEKLGKIEKDKLKTSPFKRQIDYGAMKDGYWTYEDMIVQVEDCIDCLKAIHGNAYEYLFLFDHSNGHDRLSPDALSASAIRKGFGGSQPFMKNSVIEDESYLGPFDHPTKLKVGDIQTMSFSIDDPGPFYLSDEERKKQMFDKILGSKERKMNKPDLIKALKEHGVSNPKGTRKKLRKLCKKKQIAYPPYHRYRQTRLGK